MAPNNILQPIPEPIGIYSEDIMDWFLNDYHRTEQYMLERCIEHQDNPYQLHFDFNKLIKLYYKFKSEHPDAIQKLITVCEKDIQSIESFIFAYRKEHPHYPFLPLIPSFKCLSIVYEKSGLFSDAIKVCEKAIALNLDDGTKGGYPIRLEKLRNRLAKTNMLKG
ncbi:hypothetical protein COLU111180_04360 [Cohnella lubricantis]